MLHIINIDPYDYEWPEDIQDRTKLLTRDEWRAIDYCVSYDCAFGRSEVELCEEYFRDDPDKIAEILGYESWEHFSDYRITLAISRKNRYN